MLAWKKVKYSGSHGYPILLGKGTSEWQPGCNGTGIRSGCRQKLVNMAGSFAPFAYCASQDSKVAPDIPDLVSMAL